jgi:molecular chaperone GrpE
VHGNFLKEGVFMTKKTDNKKNNLNDKEELEANKQENKNMVSSSSEFENLNSNESENFKKQLIQVSADFQNFKKRVEKEKTEWINIAQAEIISAFLPFIDDLERAIRSCEEHDEKVSWLEGFKIIQKNLKKTFDNLGVKEIDCSDEFDPQYHEALMSVDSDDHESGQIVQVLNKGYLYKDKVLRHAKVSVAK